MIRSTTLLITCVLLAPLDPAAAADREPSFNAFTYDYATEAALAPANPAANCVTSNDDGSPGACSRVTLVLGLNETVVVVVTSYGNGATFDYQVNFDGTIGLALQVEGIIESRLGGISFPDGSLQTTAYTGARRYKPLRLAPRRPDRESSARVPSVGASDRSTRP